MKKGYLIVPALQTNRAAESSVIRLLLCTPFNRAIVAKSLLCLQPAHPLLTRNSVARRAGSHYIGGMNRIRESLVLALTAAATAVLLAAPARAADSSPWVDDTQSALRLIAGSNGADAAPLRAGIEIKLGPGWHTYWRYPGDSGVPPRFVFSGSDNVAAVKVLYPAPHAYTDEAGTIIGYKDDVIFPLRVVPRHKGEPVTLHLKAEYAVCDKLCVPVEASATLTLDAAPSASDAALVAAEAQVPRAESAADAGLTARRVNNAAKPLVAVDLPAATGSELHVFVEGPTPEWALPIPKPAQGAPAGHVQFGFDLDGLPPGVDPKGPFELTFTIVGGAHPVEVKTHLD
jgi:DsbC/DsbD-like thiol-disulfide interchange protein